MVCDAAAGRDGRGACSYRYVDVDKGPGLYMEMEVSGSRGTGVASATFKEGADGHYTCHDLSLDFAVQGGLRQRLVLVSSGRVL